MELYIVAGLGNPGRRYENTRHNLGFITVDYLAGEHGIKVNKIKHKAVVGEGTISGRRVLLVKPQTYMNLSGNSIREVMAFYKVDISHLIVIYDDVDLATGQIRVRPSGSAGTHNGMRSILYDLQDDGFPRVRIGIGKDNRMDLADFVTGGFTAAEKEPLTEAVKQAANAVRCILERGIDAAMAEYNIKRKQAGEEKEDE